MEKLNLYDFQGDRFILHKGRSLTKINDSQEETSFKQLLFTDSIFVIIDQKSLEVVGEISDTQPLHLYPLTVLDHVLPLWKFINGRTNRLPTVYLKVEHLLWDDSFDFIMSLFRESVEMGVKRMGLELNLKTGPLEISFERLISFVHRCKNELDIKLTIVVDNLPYYWNLIDMLSAYSDYIRVNLFDLSQTSSSLRDSLCLISRIKAGNSFCDGLLTVRTHLRIEDVDRYPIISDKLENMGVDIFQVSKRLQPFGLEHNLQVPKRLQAKMRHLSTKHNGNSGSKFRFIHVRDLSNLYYSRFELDERNSRMCISSQMRPTIVGANVFPCSSQKIISAPNDWSLGTVFEEQCIYSRRAQNVYTKAGTACDDCANIFENDFLFSVYKLINKFEGRDLKFFLAAENDF